MIFLSAADTEALFDWTDAIACIRGSYSADHAPKGIPGRLIASDKSAWIRCMPAIPSSGQFMGSKQIVRTRSGQVTYLITLYDKETGELAYVIDGISITSMRTAATSAAALCALAGTSALSVGLLGSGLEARMHAHAVCTSLKVAEVVIFSPTPSNRDRLASELTTAYGIPARAVDNPADAVRNASCAIAAARSRDESPILHADWLRPEAIVISIGSTTPTQREVDVSVVERASLIVADVPDELAHDTGDMRAASESGIDFEDKLISLQELMRGSFEPRRPQNGFVMFKSVGSALQDIAFAETIAHAAHIKGIGTKMAVELSIKQSIGKNQ